MSRTEEMLFLRYCPFGKCSCNENKCKRDELFHLADTGHAGDHQFVVAVALHGCLTEEQVNLVVVSLGTHLTLWHLSHGNKGGLWHREKKCEI